MIEPKFEEFGDSSEGLIPARSGSVLGYVYAKGDWKIEPQFLRAKNFKEGWAEVSAANGKGGGVNPEGKFAVRKPARVGDLATVAGH